MLLSVTITSDIAVVGAGPYGLAAAARLRRSGADVHIFGDPMSFWRTMPIGMRLRSNRIASSIAEREGELSLDTYCEVTEQQPVGNHLELQRFVEYGEWVQKQVAPDLDRRMVARVEEVSGDFQLTLDDGERFRARRVILACGLAPFAQRPRILEELDPELASHTGDHPDYSRFAGQSVAVVGAGQSALEAAALLHEAGAEAQVLVRADHVHWLHGGKYQKGLGHFAPLLYAPTDVGPMGLSRLVAVPDLFRRLPRRVQDPLAHRSIRPAGAAWLVARLEKVPIRVSLQIRKVQPKDGRLRVELNNNEVINVDHLLFGTGYRVDVARYSFLTPALLQAVQRAEGYPILRSGLESSVPRLHFLGAPAAHSFGPIMRFVSGSWYASQALVRSIIDDAGRTQP